jgi:type IX secretion system PorP/SprF family membrane protein
LKRLQFYLAISIGLLIFSGENLVAQDLHFSQYQHTPLNINPALTGIYSGDQRYAANYRHQWFNVPVEYMTFTGAADFKFQQDGASHFWSAGAVFDYDRAGDSKLRVGYLGLSGSYTHGLSPNALLTGGVTIGFGQRAFTTTDLLWDSNWNGTSVDPSIAPGNNFDGSNFVFVDLGAGLNLRLQKSSRTRLDLGAGAFHLNKPRQAFYSNSDFKLPVRIALNGIGSLKIAKSFDFLFNALAQFQGPYDEIVLSGLIGIHISQRRAREVQLHLGIGTRLDDALIPQIALVYDGLKVGFSYDINTSPFKTATNERGGPEFSLVYIITKVRPLPEAKVCRIF